MDGGILRPDVPVTTVVAIASLEEAQSFETRATWTPAWCVRDGTVDDAALLRTDAGQRIKD